MTFTNQLLESVRRDDGELIASFGEARVFRKLNGKFQLLGGTDADRTEAIEWCSMFLHEAVFCSTPPRMRHAPTRHLQPQHP